MEAVVKWLSANGFNLFIAIGGLSGYAAVAWSALESGRADRSAMAARLAIKTSRTEHGALEVEFAFDPPDRSEPHALVIKADRRDGLIVYNAVSATVPDGQGGFMPAGPGQMFKGRELEVPLHQTRSGPSVTSAYVLKSGSEGAIENIESGKVTIRVVATASRKNLISITRTISAKA